MSELSEHIEPQREINPYDAAHEIASWGYTVTLVIHCEPRYMPLNDRS